MAGSTFTPPKTTPWATGDGTSAQFNAYIRTPILELQSAATASPWQFPAVTGVTNGTPPLKFRLEGAGTQVRLAGRVTHSGLNSSPLQVCVLPVGYRPDDNGFTITGGSTGTVIRVDFGTDGQILVRQNIGSPVTTVFDGITFPTP